MTTASIERFVAWLKQGGADLAGVELRLHDDGERAVHATRRIEAGETVVRIPPGLVMKGEEPAGSLPGQVAFLLHARQRRELALEPWLESLPESPGGHPVFFGPSSLALLEGAGVQRDVEEVRGRLEAQHRAVAGSDALAGCTWEDFAWARWILVTRAFHVEGQQGSVRVLVPMADMLNHGRDPSCHWAYEPDTGGFRVEALRAIEAGEELLRSYGDLCACRLFVQFGFLTEAGAADCVTLKLRAGSDRDGIDTGMATNHHVLTDAPSLQQMLSFLRLGSAVPPPRQSGPPPLPPHVPPRSIARETEALTSLIAQCDAALARLSAGTDARAKAWAACAPGADVCARICDAESRALAFHRDFARLVLEALPSRPALEGLAGDPRHAAHADYFRDLLELHDP